MTESAVLLTSIEGALCRLTMNRPERRNALNAALMEALYAALVDADANDDIGTILLAANGPAFCVGGDVKDMSAGVGRSVSLEERISGLRKRMEVARLLHDSSKLTVAAVQGAVAGAGLSLALACDFRIVARSAKITTAFAKVGLSGDFGGSWFLTRIVGTAKARDLYLRPRVITADEALDMGLVTEVVDDEALASRAAEFAAELAAGPRVTQRYIKQNMNLAEVAPLDKALDMEAMRHVLSTFTEDHKEAAQAFVEKRAPVFRGR